ncbi:hypothetical protein [Nocardia otitidiscaviarum]|uniref:hypothetical protein n=1 Tax=Nocardia otitidiscaviarum TaxID=1823 RepID=UPI0018938308|nr:hypothetical protein [Nocardia otitidiscaviarum]MBF6178242.1 hypothetical protein [Nocardia otitidiscaviarum]
MKKAIITAARLAVAGISGLALTAVVGSGTAQAAPHDCVVERDLTGASAICLPDGGDNYVLRVECFGLHAAGPFPLYAVGPYHSLSYPFTPSGDRITASCTGAGPGLLAITTNAYVEIYRG